MDQVVRSFSDRQLFMGAVLVARGDQVLFNKGFGSANLEWDIPNSPQSKFRLGSLTKQFTAASSMLLEERGKLKTEDPVKKYMPDAPAAWDGITIFHLLTHTSGIPNFTNLPEYRKMEPFATPVGDIIALFRDRPLDFAPGEKWNYSNSGYVVLGYLIEKISGESYQKFLQENIFTPLGMKDSGYDSNSAIEARRDSGYTRGASGIENTGYIHMTVPFSAGALYSTTGDLLRWEQGLFGGKVLTAASLQKLTTPFKNDYAFGLIVHTVHGHKVIEHDGGIEGFNTHLQYSPDDKLTVVVLANLNGTAPGEIGAKLASVAYGEKVTLPSERKEIAIPAATLAKYAGRYQMTPAIELTVTVDGDQLYAQLTGQGRNAIYPESATSFFLKVVDAQIDFTKDGLILHQGGRDLHGVRK